MNQTYLETNAELSKPHTAEEITALDAKAAREYFLENINQNTVYSYDGRKFYAEPSYRLRHNFGGRPFRRKNRNFILFRNLQKRLLRHHSP